MLEQKTLQFFRATLRQRIGYVMPIAVVNNELATRHVIANHLILREGDMRVLIEAPPTASAS